VVTQIAPVEAAELQYSITPHDVFGVNLSATAGRNQRKMLLSLEGSNCASFKLLVDNIRAVETVVVG
jgi:hypothetical protein